MMNTEALFTTESRTLNSSDLTEPKSSENIFFHQQLMTHHKRLSYIK